MQATKRHAALVALINSNVVRSQTDARKLLIKKGFRTTQATVSRDLEKIGAVRVRDPGGFKYAVPLTSSPFGAPAQNAFKNYILSVTQAGNIVVVKTPPGHAGVVASAIDRENPPDVLGTVAGDDTLFICITSESAGTAIKRMLESD